MKSALGSLLGEFQEAQQEPDDFRASLLLHPVASTVDEFAEQHVGAGLGLHGLEHTRSLVDSPVLLARDERGGHVDGAAGPGLQFRIECTGGAAAIPLQTAL